MSQAINRKLCEALGIDVKHCTGFDLRVRVGELPSLTVHRLLISSDDIEAGTDIFDLTIRPRPFDLDRACQEALKRLARYVDQSAARARADLRRLEVERAIAGAAA
jgi:hypothetical protein